MRRSLIVLTLLVVTACPAFAQQPTDANKISAADLEEMLAPIALYPDTLLANVLAGSCYPKEIEAAHKYIANKGDPAKAAAQGWEPPVVSLAKVPDALKMMAESMDWTEALGQAYIVQSQDVMKAVQELRKKAQASGALKTSTQQTVVEKGDTVIIESPQPTVVYVPTYNPAVVYAPPPPSGPPPGSNLVSFGVGMLVGAAFADNDCNWHGGYVGWGHGDVDVDIDVNQNVNVNRNTNISNTNINAANVNRTNVNSQRTGREGTPFTPNSAKVNTAAITAPGGASKLQGYKGASAGTMSNTAKIPNRPSGSDFKPVSGNRAAPSAGSANRAAPKPLPKAPSASPAASPRTADTARAAPSRAQSSDSGFSVNSDGGRSAGDRGAASRGGGSSGGGGGGRSAPARGGGGGGGRR